MIPSPMSEVNGEKYFVLDTNVLLHNPAALFMFKDNEVIIPFDVIEELDKFKTNNDDLGRNARSVIRHLDRLRQAGNLSEGVNVPETGGTVRVILEEDQKLCPGLTVNTPDNRIICTAFSLQQEGKHVVFISKDINARIKSDTMGIVTEDFEAQKVDFEHLFTGWRELMVSGDVIDSLFAKKQHALEGVELFANEFVLLKDELEPSHTALARYRADVKAIVPVRPRRAPVFGILARNLQQTMALDLLLDDSVKLVTLIGSAGTGKTLLALAAGMTKTLNEQVYQKLLCARPIMPLGRDIGYARRQGPEADRLDAADLRQHGVPAVQPPQLRGRRRRAQGARQPLVGRAAHPATDGERPGRARAADLHPRPEHPPPVHDRGREPEPHPPRGEDDRQPRRRGDEARPDRRRDADRQPVPRQQQQRPELPRRAA